MAEEKRTLQQALSRLDKIIEELKSKDVDVEEGLKKFREGAELVKFARAQLKKTENEFQKVKKELEEGEEHE